MYKRYYSNESIFFNELHMLVRRQNGDLKDDNRGWISVGRKVRTTVNKDKYNFLEDKNRKKSQFIYL
jgi:hypothetical protein